jgi:DNA polymerase V
VLVVDRSISASHGDIVIACVNGELMVKRLEMEPKLRLVAMNRLHAPIEVPDEADLEVFGVATTVIHSLRKS